MTEIGRKGEDETGHDRQEAGTTEKEEVSAVSTNDSHSTHLKSDHATPFPFRSGSRSSAPPQRRASGRFSRTRRTSSSSYRFLSRSARSGLSAVSVSWPGRRMRCSAVGLPSSDRSGREGRLCHSARSFDARWDAPSAWRNCVSVGREVGIKSGAGDSRSVVGGGVVRAVVSGLGWEGECGGFGRRG